jgi:hypothetical protein
VTQFDAYLLEVQRRNGLQPIALIRNWTSQEIATAEAALRAAIAESKVLQSIIPTTKGKTNQSIGNRAADHFIATVSKHLPAPSSIVRAKGAGYPDRIFLIGKVGFCMELKATSNWHNGDLNRRVLTSSPEKMRQLVDSGQITNPPAHLICTVIYSKDNSKVTQIRLDFLKSDSPVNIRLEASTSQKRLTQGLHHKFNIP